MTELLTIVLLALVKLIRSKLILFVFSESIGWALLGVAATSKAMLRRWIARSLNIEVVLAGYVVLYKGPRYHHKKTAYKNDIDQPIKICHTLFPRNA